MRVDTDATVTDAQGKFLRIYELDFQLSGRRVQTGIVYGFISLGGMVAQVIALKRPALLRRIILTGTGPEGGVGVARDRPELLEIFVDQQMPASAKLRKLFFESTESSQSAGRQFVQRLARRIEDHRRSQKIKKLQLLQRRPEPSSRRCLHGRGPEANPTLT
jgi:pimeloyl-ACP methyl ester carboxylesterase